MLLADRGLPAPGSESLEATYQKRGLRGYIWGKLLYFFGLEMRDDLLTYFAALGR